jgi:hypothetical protein
MKPGAYHEFFLSGRLSRRDCLLVKPHAGLDPDNSGGNSIMYRYIALAALCMATIPAHSGELGAMKAESIDLGGLLGVVYYTPEEDGYRVVTTIAQGEAGSPVRFVAILTEHQTVAVSVPGNLGESDRIIEISRVGGKLFVSPRPPADGPDVDGIAVVSPAAAVE